MKTVLFSGAVLLALAAAALAQQVEVVGQRYTVAVRYPQGKETSISMVGTNLAPGLRGKAEVKRTEGRTRVTLKMESLTTPQSIGPMYTTYILWAIAPEGQADNLAEVPFMKGDVDIDVTTPLQTFSLIITAEPYGTVKLPGPAVLAENVLRKGTEGAIESTRIQYRGDPGTFYESQSVVADFNTPLLVLGARRAVEIARRAGASRYAEPELRKAEIDLAALEQVWPMGHNQEKKYGGMARDIMREAESARELAVQRGIQARLAAEREGAARSINRAESQAEVAREQADAARREAESYKQQMARAEQEVAEAQQRVSDARDEAARAKANEDLERARAAEARLQAERATQEKNDLEQHLYDQISLILETRREARGLVVSLSDVLFDTGHATLKPGAREKLSKLAGILLAYPGSYKLEITGHTDSVGSDELNMRLSEQRAASVQTYLLGQEIPADRMVAVRGFGKTMPVASNATPEGRQMNRRVEILISDVSPTISK